MKDTLIQCFMYYTGAPSTWNGDLDALLYGVRITEEDFDRFYTEISKNLKTMKQIRNDNFMGKHNDGIDLIELIK